MFGKKNKQKGKSCIGQHISGMDIPNIPVLVLLDDSGVTINAISLKKEYTIAIDKISSINCYHETEIEKHMKSSFVGGVIGAATFGMPGAIIGSRPKEKNKKKVTFYLLIDYSDKQIVISSEDGFSIGSVVDLFNKLKPNSDNVQSISL